MFFRNLTLFRFPTSLQLDAFDAGLYWPNVGWIRPDELVLRRLLPLMDSDWGVARSRLHFIPLGIDTDFYTEQPLPAEPGLVMSAGEDRFRDHGLLIRAVSAVRDRRSRSPCSSRTCRCRR